MYQQKWRLSWILYVDIVLYAKNPRDLKILMKFRHKIEEHIVDYLNSKSYRKD
jgi:hypothetical protein